MKIRLLSTLAFAGVSILLMGVTALTPAQADDFRNDRRDIRHDQRDINHDSYAIRNDRRDIRHDRGVIAQMDRHLENEVEHRHYLAAQHTEQNIDRARRDINHDRRDIRHDQRDINHDRRDVNHDRRDLRHDW